MSGKNNLKRKIRARSGWAVLMLALFVLLTALLMKADVRAIGPENSSVGLAGINGFVHEKLGTSDAFYRLTDLMGKADFLFVLAFAALGLVQLVCGRSLKAVDGSLYLLAGFYVVVGACYVLFEKFVVNCRPVLENGQLEASFPSSHTLLAVTILGSAMVQLRQRIHSRGLRTAVNVVFTVLIAVMAVGRLLSGVHWLTDILGGVLLGAALVLAYDALTLELRRRERKKEKKRRARA